MIYILDYKKQVRRINEMVTVRKDMETMEVFYHDERTGELWKSFFPRYTKTERGPKLLRPEPLPDSLEIQLENCLNSENESDPVGLGIELSVNPVKWHEIVNLLSKNRRNYRRSNFFTFLKHSRLLDPIESLNEIGLEPKIYGMTEAELKEIRKRTKFLKFKRFFGI